MPLHQNAGAVERAAFAETAAIRGESQAIASNGAFEYE
jgi:hypothetical protein